ncbi:uncharacterized protein LOC131018928 [Salvia miltiorrhiza]|uniref:uncharacterized protein LOC131018928 n=1 Tax=Salvia miltiorrhiza TaxID=226208 RepID=UPI0025ACE7FF|nr:uncharacterized protein LOC131018928 [Salvia miltiorrhiza]
MGEWIDESWMWSLNWRRVLLDREVEQTQSLLGQLSGFSPCVGSVDKWFWRAQKNGVYTANSAYQAIRDQIEERRVEPEEMNLFSDLWNSTAPQKVRVTTWRVLRNRLPTCDNLIRRNIQVGEVEKSCVACFFPQESAIHLFLDCPKSAMIWDQILNWTGYSWARPRGIPEHFSSFVYLANGKNSTQLLKALWMCTIWVIWRKRNESRFEDKVWELKSIIMEIKTRMWSWNKIFGFFAWEPPILEWCSSQLYSFML